MANLNAPEQLQPGPAVAQQIGVQSGRKSTESLVALQAIPGAIDAAVKVGNQVVLHNLGQDLQEVQTQVEYGNDLTSGFLSTPDSMNLSKLASYFNDLDNGRKQGALTESSGMAKKSARVKEFANSYPHLASKGKELLALNTGNYYGSSGKSKREKSPQEKQLEIFQAKAFATGQSLEVVQQLHIQKEALDAQNVVISLQANRGKALQSTVVAQASSSLGDSMEKRTMDWVSQNPNATGAQISAYIDKLNSDLSIEVDALSAQKAKGKFGATIDLSEVKKALTLTANALKSMATSTDRATVLKDYNEMQKQLDHKSVMQNPFLRTLAAIGAEVGDESALKLYLDPTTRSIFEYSENLALQLTPQEHLGAIMGVPGTANRLIAGQVKTALEVGSATTPGIATPHENQLSIFFNETNAAPSKPVEKLSPAEITEGYPPAAAVMKQEAITKESPLVLQNASVGAVSWLMNQNDPQFQAILKGQFKPTELTRPMWKAQFVKHLSLSGSAGFGSDIVQMWSGLITGQSKPAYDGTTGLFSAPPDSSRSVKKQVSEMNALIQLQDEHGIVTNKDIGILADPDAVVDHGAMVARVSQLVATTNLSKNKAQLQAKQDTIQKMVDQQIHGQEYFLGIRLPQVLPQTHTGRPEDKLTLSEAKYLGVDPDSSLSGAERMVALLKANVLLDKQKAMLDKQMNQIDVDPRRIIDPSQLKDNASFLDLDLADEDVRGVLDKVSSSVQAAIKLANDHGLGEMVSKYLVSPPPEGTKLPEAYQYPTSTEEQKAQVQGIKDTVKNVASDPQDELSTQMTEVPESLKEAQMRAGLIMDTAIPAAEKALEAARGGVSTMIAQGVEGFNAIKDTVSNLLEGTPTTDAGDGASLSLDMEMLNNSTAASNRGREVSTDDPLPGELRTAEALELARSALYSGNVDTIKRAIPFITEAGKQELKQVMDKLTHTDVKEANEVIQNVHEDLLTHEGASGDTATSVKTLSAGLTERKYREMQAIHGKDITEEQARTYFLEHLYGLWSEKPGFKEAPPELKEGLLDLSYNVGAGSIKYKGLGKSLERLGKGKATPADVMLNVLDTANIDGQSSRGVAKRRAQQYNSVSDVNITEVEQLSDGTLVYRSGKDEVYRYTAKKGRSHTSKVGIVAIPGAQKYTRPPGLYHDGLGNYFMVDEAGKTTKV